MINRLLAFRVNFLAAILMITSLVVGAQTYKELGGTGQIANGLMARNYFHLPNDTILSDAKNSDVDTCQQIAKKGTDIYSYDCAQHKWVKIVSGVALAIDSVRRSHDTLYFHRTTGGELAIDMDYYTKEESDNRYVLSPSGKITSNWLTAWDYCIAADVPNIPDPESKYLIVNGTAGDTAFTVVGGTGMSDFTPNFAAVAYARVPNRYFSFFVVRQSGSTFNTDRPLKYNLVNDTIHFMWNAYQGQHMTWYGYKGYADMIYDYHKSLAQKDYKLYSFYPEDNPSVPFVAINGATQGGFIPSTSIPQLYSITTATINYSQIATNHLIIQQGTVAGRGGEWQVNLGKKNGYLETWVGINRNLPGFARVLFYLDGVLKKVDTVRGAVQKLTYSYSNASTGKIQVVTGDTQNTAIRIGRTIWYQTDIDTATKVYNGGKIMFVGDSWTQFPIIGGVNFQGVTNRFKERYSADGGDPADIINVGRGGMTSVWGRYWLNYWLALHNPKFVYLEFYINDSNSSSSYGDPGVTTWNFSSSDPYSAGTDVDGKITMSGWLDNLYAMGDTVIAHNAIPIHLMNSPTASLTQTQGQSVWHSALRPASQYYDIETFFTSGVYADQSITTPVLNATTGNVDTTVTKETKGGTAVINGSYLVELQALNSSTTTGMLIYPKVNYTGSVGSLFKIQNVPTIGSGTVFTVANNGLTTSAVGFSAGVSGYAIPPFTITYNAGIARISATNSTTVQDLYIADSLTGVIRLRAPAVLANYTTSTLPTSSLKRVKGALVYDTDVDKPAVTNGFSWDYLAKESLVLSRYDSSTAKNNFIRNSAAYAGSPQIADILNVGTMRNDGPLIVNGSARFNLGSDLKWDIWTRDSATGTMLRIPAAPFGYTLKAGPGGKPEWKDQSGDFIRNQQAVVQTGDYNISGNGIANKFLAAAGTSGGAMTHYTMATTGFVNRFTLDLTGTESGSNAGGNWQLNRWSDAGTSLGAALFARRSDGFVGVGTTSPTYKLSVSAGVMYGDGIGTSIVTKNTDNTASITNETVLNCTTSITQTLPDAASANYGKIFIINKDYPAGSPVTVVSNSIDGAATYTLTDTVKSITVISSGVSWRIISTKIGPAGYQAQATPTLAQVTTSGSTTANSITVGDVSTSNATAYSSGGITAIGRNNTSGRLETFTAGSVVALKDFYTDQGNTSTSVGISNALYTYSIPANRLSAVGEKITAVFGGTFATNGNTKSLGVGFGIHANIGSNSVTLNGVGWIVRVTIIRINSNTIRTIVELPGVDAVVGEYTSIDFTVSNDLVLSGAGGGAVNDVVAKMGSIKWETAAP
jgi:hypothetical protein